MHVRKTVVVVFVYRNLDDPSGSNYRVLAVKLFSAHVTRTESPYTAI